MRFKALKGVRGIQKTAYQPEFYFSWDVSSDDRGAYYLWVYKEDEPKPFMIQYAQCFNRQVRAIFQSNSTPLTDIRKLKFLIFVSDVSQEPTKTEISEMLRDPEFICEVCCGSGQVFWHWDHKKAVNKLVIESEKNISEGILYFEYPYGFNQINIEIEIPGEIPRGKSVYPNIIYPGIAEEPQLKSREKNVQLEMKKTGVFPIPPFFKNKKTQ